MSSGLSVPFAVNVGVFQDSRFYFPLEGLKRKERKNEKYFPYDGTAADAGGPHGQRCVYRKCFRLRKHR